MNIDYLIRPFICISFVLFRSLSLNRLLCIFLYCSKLLQIGVHYGGTFYEFVPWNGVVNWEIAPWGYWFMSADNGRHVVNFLFYYYLIFSPYGKRTKSSNFINDPSLIVEECHSYKVGQNSYIKKIETVDI